MDAEMEKLVEDKYRHLEETIKYTNPSVDLQRVRMAFEYAKKEHGGQLRKDGTPYITHPVAAAEIIAEMSMDEVSIIAALLHDCIEDTRSTHEEVEKLFGSEVAEIVEGVTKLTRVTYTSKEDEQMEKLKREMAEFKKAVG